MKWLSTHAEICVGPKCICGCDWLKVRAKRYQRFDWFLPSLLPATVGRMKYPMRVTVLDIITLKHDLA